MHRALEGAWREVELVAGANAAHLTGLHKIMEPKIVTAVKEGKRDEACLKRFGPERNRGPLLIARSFPQSAQL
jgi:hypothetical protein